MNFRQTQLSILSSNYNSIKRAYSTIHFLEINNDGDKPNLFKFDYYSDNFNNYDFPYKYFINFFFLVRNLDVLFFRDEEVKALCNDYCILLNIKVKPNLKIENQEPAIFEFNEIPVYLDYDKQVLNLIFYISNKIIQYTKNIDYETFGFAVDITFEFKFISFQEYEKLALKK